jgi:hypothetical protein
MSFPTTCYDYHPNNFSYLTFLSWIEKARATYKFISINLIDT